MSKYHVSWFLNGCGVELFGDMLVTMSFSDDEALSKLREFLVDKSKAHLGDSSVSVIANNVVITSLTKL